MIHVGLAGWGDHDDLYPTPKDKRNKLKVYSSHFPIVEVDSSFYAIQPTRNYMKWADETPSHFGFIIKAYQGMTGHLRGKSPFQDQSEMFGQFKESIKPIIDSGKLKTVLFQYPPWFSCTRENIGVLRYVKEAMLDIPVALEFRNQTWFSQEMKDKTLEFMEKEGWVHSVCDEPQAGIGSIPTVLHPTNALLTIVRFHGRHAEGWNNNGQANWRDVRYLYRYNQTELREWITKLRELETSTEEVCVIFNNNSGGDAASNAKDLMGLLGIQQHSTTEEQMSLFDFDPDN
jgi:uncharacterized protein YecE (DUF72 family)